MNLEGLISFSPLVEKLEDTLSPGAAAAVVGLLSLPEIPRAGAQPLLLMLGSRATA